MEHRHTLNVERELMPQGWVIVATEGENTYTCTGCGQSIILMWEGIQDGELFTPTVWSLRHEDEHDTPIGKVAITYIDHEQAV